MNMRLALVLVLGGSFALPGCFVDTPDPVPEDSTTQSEVTVADDSAGEESVCPQYCTLVQDVCTADFAQYMSEAVCEAVCEALPPGNPDDQLGNSAACRNFQAAEAAENPATFCGAAGPTGDSVCGAPCETFCSLATEICTGELAQWPDVPSCITDCMMFEDGVMYNASVTTGNSYACRAYHLTVAALSPEVHCPHIVLASPTCV